MSTKPMDQRELEQQIKALAKSIQDKEPAANVVSVLTKLAKERPTEDMLRVSCIY